MPGRGTTMLLLLVSACLLLLHASAAGTDVVSVSGFVNGTDRLDSIRIVLEDLTGVKKSEGDCAPNGYYFVPANPGNYTLKVQAPVGWLFSPAAVPVLCDERQCNYGTYLDFKFAGLLLHGAVTPGPTSASCSPTASANYTDISVTARWTDGKSHPAAAATLVQNSNFTLGPLLPGEYAVTATHPEWILYPTEVRHNLSLDSSQLLIPFRVSGYQLSGFVASGTGPVAGVQVTVLSDDLTTAQCSTQHPPAHASPTGLGTALCSVLTDSKGQYVFAGLPCGTYTLIAQHPDADSSLDIQPASITAAVGHGNAKVPEQFWVTGFSVSGQVLDGDGVGVPGVDILLGGSVRATTDADGRYMVSRMQDSHLDVIAQKPYFEFSTLQQIHVQPPGQVLPDILVKSVAICGKLSAFTPELSVSNRRVDLASRHTEPQQNMTDAAGSFCFMVPPGRYRIDPSISRSEAAKGLAFSPTYTDVEVKYQPVLNVSFIQAQPTIIGTVVCLDGPCAGDVLLTLKDATGQIAVEALLDDVRVLNMGATDLTAGSAFQLPYINPGRYRLVASSAGSCWQDDEGVDVFLGAADVEAAPLRQTGYRLQVEITHPTDLTITSSNLPAPIHMHASAGTSFTCLPSSGNFEVTPSGCYTFGAEKFLVKIDPRTPTKPLVLTADRVLVSGRVVVSYPVAADLCQASGSQTTCDTDQTPPVYPDFVDVAVVTGAAVAESYKAVSSDDKPLRVTTPGDPQYKIYTYQIPVALGSRVVVMPVETNRHGLLFYPRLQAVQHDADDKECPPYIRAVVFEGRPGLRVIGSTHPAVQGAEVKLYYRTPSLAAGQAAGYMVTTSSTDADGNFHFEDLYDDALYNLTIAKRGYLFSTMAGAPIPSGGFEIQRSGSGHLQPVMFGVMWLAQVSVTVQLPARVKPSAVLLSLSGPNRSQRTAELGDDNTLAFSDLMPGPYILKPLLIEHQFDPPVATLQLVEGQAAHVIMSAVWASWGISGVVTSVADGVFASGLPLPGVVVEVHRQAGLSTMWLSEVLAGSNITDEAGRYRVGSLNSDTTYYVRVRLDDKLPAVQPQVHKVHLQTQDVTDINFIGTYGSNYQPGFTQNPAGSDIYENLGAENRPPEPETGNLRHTGSPSIDKKSTTEQQYRPGGNARDDHHSDIVDKAGDGAEASGSTQQNAADDAMKDTSYDTADTKQDNMSTGGDKITQKNKDTRDKQESPPEMVPFSATLVPNITLKGIHAVECSHMTIADSQPARQQQQHAVKVAVELTTESSTSWLIKGQMQLQQPGPYTVELSCRVLLKTTADSVTCTSKGVPIQMVQAQNHMDLGAVEIDCPQPSVVPEPEADPAPRPPPQQNGSGTQASWLLTIVAVAVTFIALRRLPSIVFVLFLLLIILQSRDA